MTSCEGAALANGTGTLIRDPGEPPRPLHHVRTQEEIGCPPTRARAPTPHPACRHLDLRLPAPRTLRNECPLFRPPGAWHFCDSGPNGQTGGGKKDCFLGHGPCVASWFGFAPTVEDRGVAAEGADLGLRPPGLRSRPRHKCPAGRGSSRRISLFLPFFRLPGTV